MFNPFVRVVEDEGYTVVFPSKLGELLFIWSFGWLVPRVTFKRNFNLRQRLIVRGTVHVRIIGSIRGR